MTHSNILILLPLLLIFTLPSTKADEVTFNGTFTCNITSRSDDYCIMLRYMERDEFNDDPISIGEIECGGPKESHVHAIFDGGDGPLDEYYEFFVSITHNCTHDGRTKFMQHIFPDVRIDTKNKTFNYEEDLTDEGFVVSNFVFPPYIEE